MSETTVLGELRIPDFILYCHEKGLEIPMGEEETNENRKRTGAKEPLYPPQYYAGQYCPLWKVPHAADSPYYQSVNKK